MLKLIVKIVCILFSINCFASKEDKLIKIASGPVSGYYHFLASKLCKSVEKDYAKYGYECQVIKTDGSIDNIKLLKEGLVDFAIIQADIAHDAYFGMDYFENQPAYLKLRKIFPLKNESLSFISKYPSEFNNINDLRDAVVSTTGSQSGVYKLLNILTKEYQIDFKQTILNSNYRDESLCNSQVASVVMVESHPSAMIGELRSLCQLNILSFDKDIIEDITNKYPYYFHYILPGNSYIGIKNDINMIGVSANLYSSLKIAPEKIKVLVKGFNENYECEFAKYLSETSIKKKQTDKVPNHYLCN